LVKIKGRNIAPLKIKVFAIGLPVKSLKTGTDLIKSKSVLSGGFASSPEKTGPTDREVSFIEWAA